MTFVNILCGGWPTFAGGFYRGQRDAAVWNAVLLTI